MSDLTENWHYWIYWDNYLVLLPGCSTVIVIFLRNSCLTFECRHKEIHFCEWLNCSSLFLGWTEKCLIVNYLEGCFLIYSTFSFNHKLQRCYRWLLMLAHDSANLYVDYCYLKPKIKLVTWINKLTDCLIN